LFDAIGLSRYSAGMEKEFQDFESKLSHFVQLFQRLRSENNELRQQLAAKTDESRRLEEKLEQARQRVEGLLKQLPEEA
jgi:cell division protein ZapB